MAETTTTGQEHKDAYGGGDFENVTMEGGSHHSLGVLSFVTSVGGGGDATCLTASNRIKREGEQDFSND